jgi:4-hydroxybenzoate polyprenyltransferase
MPRSFFWHAIRLREILLMTGFSFVGVLFTDPGYWSLWTVASSSLAIVCYVMAVFFLNSYADHHADANSQRLSHVAQVPRRTYLILLLSATGAVMLFAALNGHRLLIVMVVSLLLWCLYYLPPVRLKSRLLGGTISHLAGGILHFQMGYIGFGMTDGQGWWISVFFALILAAGHFNHEMMDHDADLASGYRTTTVRWGIGSGRWLRTAVSAMSVGWAVLLYVWQMWTMVPLVALTSASVVMTIASVVSDAQGVKAFQQVSRGLFLAAGLIILADRLWVVLT